MHPQQQARFDRLYQQLLDALIRHGMASKTVEAYSRGVRRLAAHVDRCPDDCSVDELKQFFDALIASHSWSTVKVDRNGVQFFFKHIVQRDMPWVSMLKPPRVQTLPDVLTTDDIYNILSVTREFRYRVFWLATYSMGLRLGEALALSVPDIDAERSTVHVRLGKGRKDRFVYLPKLTLLMLRHLWRTHRHPNWLFPGKAPSGRQTALVHMDRGATQRAFAQVVRAAKIQKRVSIRSLRHAHATHLIEAGLNLRAVQIQLGHTDPRTTATYVHMTEKALLDQHQTLERLAFRLSALFLDAAAQPRTAS